MIAWLAASVPLNAVECIGGEGGEEVAVES